MLRKVKIELYVLNNIFSILSFDDISVLCYFECFIVTPYAWSENCRMKNKGLFVYFKINFAQQMNDISKIKHSDQMYETI